MPWAVAAAGVAAAGAVGGSVINSNAAASAAKSQQQAASNAEAQQQAQFNQTQQSLLPYVQQGTSAVEAYHNALPQLTAPFQPTMDQLAATPGYQFDLQQGLQSTQNAAAARGLGVSGAALKGAASYATGLAQQTVGQNASIYYQGQRIGQAGYNALSGLGESAAAGTGNLGQQAAANQSNLITGAGNAQAAGTVGGANALSSGLTGAGNSALNAYFLNSLQQNSNQNSLTGGVTMTPGLEQTQNMPLTTSNNPPNALYNS